MSTKHAYLKALLPHVLGPDFAPDTLHGHAIDFAVTEWPMHGRTLETFRTSPLPVTGVAARIFTHVNLCGTVGTITTNGKGKEEFPVEVSAEWVAKGGAVNSTYIGTYYFHVDTMEIFAYRTAETKHNVIFL